jgi:two-component system NtrC family response regulator
MAVLALTSRPDAFPLSRLTPVEAARLSQESDVVSGLSRLETSTWDLVLVDVDFAGGAGIELIERLSLAGQGVIALAAQPSLSLTVRALRAGARDVIALPTPLDRLRELLDSPGEAAPLDDETAAYAQWIGTSPIMLAPFRAALRLAETDQPVLLWGETGTGKELLARVMHENSPRAAEPFITVNCGYLPEQVLAAEIFGHGSGALQGVFSRRMGRLQRAGRGTLYLDEAGHMPAGVQSKLMDVLRTGVVEEIGSTATLPAEARLIVAVDRDPKRLLDEGVLRKDFYYQMSGGTIHLPPLRDRGKDDIAALATHFLRLYAARYGRRAREFSEDAWRVLLRHPWTGNVRQMRAAVERAVLESDQAVVHASHLPAELTRTVENVEMNSSLKLDDVERQHIQRVLAMAEGHLGATADMLGIHRNTLRRKLQQYDIDVE